MTQVQSIAQQSADQANAFAPLPPPPRRFIMTVFATYALFMTVLLSSGFAITNQIASGPAFSAIVSGVAFGIFAGAFALMFASPDQQNRPIVVCAIGSYVLSVLLCL